MTPEMAVIESVVFGPDVWDVPGPVRVVATFSDGTTRAIFHYFPDEISFSAAELIGLTLDEARNLRHRRDTDFLRS